MKAQPTRYSSVAIALHWLIAIAILAMLPMGFWMTYAINHPETQALAYRTFQFHKSVGFLILALTVIRILWRLSHRVPPMPPEMKPWEVAAARATHMAFYGLMLLMPLSGWLYISTGWSASGDRALDVATSWFGLFQIPHLPGLAGADGALRRTLAFQALGAHSLMAWGAIVLIALHVGAALKHHFISGDDVLAQMIPLLKRAPSPHAGSEGGSGKGAANGAGIVLIALLAVVGGFRATPAPKAVPAAKAQPATPPQPATAAAPASQPSAPQGVVTATRWSIDYAASSIGFSGTQAGAPFNGRFGKWQGEIAFDPADLAGSKAVVLVETGSASTGDATQEGSLQSAEWLDPAGYPTARFEATSFRALGGDRYEASGTLTLKSRMVPVLLAFTFTETAGVAKVAGEATLDRTALDLGMTSDATADWVSKAIPVRIAVTAKKVP